MYWPVVAQPRFATMHQITEHIYLTGFFGINKEDLMANKIRFIVNVTGDKPDMKGYETMRIDVSQRSTEWRDC